MTRLRLVWVALLVLAGIAAAAQAPTAPLVVTSAVPDAASQTVTITGGNFGNRPFVTLDLVPLTVRGAIDTQIVASVPMDQMPPGQYFLTVSRGPSATERGTFRLALGAANAKPGEADTAPAPSLGGSDPAARVGDRVISVAEVDREWRRTDPGSQVALSRELHEVRRRIVQTMVADELIAREAASRGLTTDALLAEEIPRRTIEMPEAAVTSLYLGLGDRTRGATLEQLRPALRAWLQQVTEPELARMNYVEELMKVSTRAEIFLVAPRVRVERTAQDATVGPDAAPVEIVAFGDFQSDEYVRFAAMFTKVRDTFGDRVRIVFKNLATLGPESVGAAEAAQCAKAQGKFWEYHDALVGVPGPLGPTRLAQSASQVGLNRSAFDACVDGGTFRSVIRESIDEAGRYGLRASPGFLVNGQLALDPPTFLPPFDFFKRIIEEELGRQAKDASPGR
jgi:protein-disulfide isomerase